MSFLNPGLWGLLLPVAALPVAIHLLNRGFPKVFRFPSVERIKETLARRSRLHRWRHYILLALRTALLTLLLLAFLRPVLPRFGAEPAVQGARHVVLVLDRSLSMEHLGEGPPSRVRAVHAAEELLGTLAAADRVNLVLMGPEARACFPEFTRDVDEAKRFLARLGPGLGRGDVHRANALVSRLLEGARSRPEVYYFSDFQRKNWADVRFGPFPEATRLFFVNVGPSRRDNVAVLEVKADPPRVLAGDVVELEVTLGNYAGEPLAQRLTVRLDDHHSSDHEVSAPPWSETRVKVAVPAGPPGLRLGEVRLPPDGLPQDNRHRLVLPVQEKEEILIVSDREGDRTSAFYLAVALNPFADRRGSLLPRRIRSAELTAEQLASTRKVFLTQVQRLDAATCERLAQFLFEGGGAVYFLDGPSDAENVGSLGQAARLGPLPLELAGRQSATNLAAGAQQIVRGDFKSRYLKLFAGVTRQDLALLEFYDYHLARATGSGSILLTFADESPAMAALHSGLGTLLLLNFSADETSSNLARQRVFPAWMQELAKAISPEESPPLAQAIGDVLRAEVWRSELVYDEFRGPGGAPVMVQREVQGDRCQVSFVPEELGFYTLGSPRPLYACAVNPPPEEADLRPLDTALLPSAFAEGYAAHFVSGLEDFEALARGRPIFHWFVFGALALLLAETWFQVLLGGKRR